MPFVPITLLIAVLRLFATTGQQSDVPQGWNAQTIQWQSVSPDGTKWAVLQGRDDVPGQAFTYAAFIPAGYRDSHSHGSDARIAVAQGSLKVRFGDARDFKEYGLGSFLFVPANVEHTMGADVNTVIIGTAVGPWRTDHHGHHERDNRMHR
ncbi:MAG: cupin domain-containing protein [Gemmatimonadota bacterium]